MVRLRMRRSHPVQVHRPPFPLLTGSAGGPARRRKAEKKYDVHRAVPRSAIRMIGHQADPDTQRPGMEPLRARYASAICRSEKSYPDALREMSQPWSASIFAQANRQIASLAVSPSATMNSGLFLNSGA